MPLAPGNSRSVISSNIDELTHHGSIPRSHRQIVAIALSNADKHPHSAFGGGIGTPHPYHLLAAPKIPGVGSSGGIGGGDKLMSPSQGTPFWTRSAARQINSPVQMKFGRGGGIDHMDVGGMSASEESPWTERSDARIMDTAFHGGLIPGATGGRTDRLPLSVGSNSHVIPSDAVSGVGQGSTQNGAATWAAAIRGAPWGVPLPHEMRGHGPPSPPRVSMDEQTGFAAGGYQHERTPILAASGEIVVSPEDVEALGERVVRDGKARRGESAMDAGHRVIDEAIARVRKYVIEWTKSAPPPKK